MERTMISKTGLWAGAVLLASLALAGCSKDPAEGTAGTGGREATILSIAEVNYAVSGGGSKSAESAQGGDRTGDSSADDGAPQTRAIVGGNGSTFFTDGDRLGLFLRGDGYEDVDNRIVQLDYPGEGPRKKWNITGDPIPLYDNEATVTAYFPYSDAFGLTMSAIPLNPGPYDVNTNDLVWQRDTVHAAHTQAMFLKMQHALTRVKIRLSGRQPSKQVGDVVDGGVVYWVNPDDANDFRVVALDQPELMWSASCSYDLNANARNETARNGAEIMTLAKNYSDSHTGGATGDFETDFPAFSYCYEKTDGGVSKGTWYLPSKQEMMDLYSAKDRVESVISVQNGTAFMATDYWAATEISAAGAWNVSLDDGSTSSDQKNVEYVLRCVRGPLASDVSDPGGYTGEGKITGVRIADAGDVAAEDRVVYLDGTLDLTQATPVVTPGWPDAVADKSEKTLTAEGVLYDLLLLPVDQIDEGKVMLEVELDGKVLSVPFPVDQIDCWEAGKAYTYEVSIRNGEAQVVFGKATVTPWNYGGSISGDLDTSKPEYGGGDVQDWGGNDWETEEGGDEPVTGEVTAASLVSAPADNVIPAEGGEYSVRLTGNWAGSVPVRMSVGGNTGGLLHAVCSNGAATCTFTVPANTSYSSSRTVTFEYLWNGTWIVIATGTQQAKSRIGELYGGGVIYWVDPDDENNFRVVALDDAELAWAASCGYVLGEGARDRSARNGADVWQIAKLYSENKEGGASGTFATDFPAFGYCYDYKGPDGTDPKGTWYLPSLRELEDLLSARSKIEDDIIALGGKGFGAYNHWSATDSPGGANIEYIYFGNGKHNQLAKTNKSWHARCIRSK